MAASALSQVFRRFPSSNTNLIRRHLPRINAITNNLANFYSEISQTRRKKELVIWYKNIPELTAFANKIAADSVSRFHFEPISTKTDARNKIMRANRFSQEVVLRQQLNEQMADCLITGEAFGWLGFIKEEQIKAAIEKVVSKRKIETKEVQKIKDKIYRELKETNGLADIEGVDEDLLRPRKYRAMASSTVEILYDEYDVQGYQQVVGVIPEKYTTKEIVHYTLLKRDGKPYGFTPVESIVVQLEGLRQMWQNMLSIHKNGGGPDKIFVGKNLTPGTMAYQRIEEQLEEMTKVENRHGNLFLTGDFDVMDLQQIDKMQFKDQGLYITGIIAMQWGLPRSSIPFIVGDANTKDDTGGNSERGYWETIYNLQQTFADIMNTQLWLPYFGVRIVFDNPYLNKNIQEETFMMSKLNNIMSMDTILQKANLQIEEKKRLNMLGFSKEDVEELKIQPIGDGTSAEGMGTSEQLSNPAVKDSDDKKNIKKKKKEEQDKSNESRGTKPTGV